jgi:hypothetical protein
VSPTPAEMAAALAHVADCDECQAWLAERDRDD